MPVQQPSERLQLRSRVQVSWKTIALFAVVIAYVDGFWMITLRGAVGAIDRIQSPFSSWLWQSTVLAPVFFLAVMGALLLARRWFDGRRRGVRLLGTVAVLVVLTTVLAIGVVAATSAVDYQSQAKLLGLTHAAHAPTVPAQASAAATAALGRCDALCEARRETVGAHVRAVTYGSVVLLVTNLVLVLWILALLGGRLWSPTTAARDRRDDEPEEPSSQAALALV